MDKKMNKIEISTETGILYKWIKFINTLHNKIWLYYDARTLSAHGF